MEKHFTAAEYEKLLSDLMIQNYELCFIPSQFYNQYELKLIHIDKYGNDKRISEAVLLPLSDHGSLSKICKYILHLKKEIEKYMSPERKKEHLIKTY